LRDERRGGIPPFMKATDSPLPPEIWAATPGAAQALIVTLQAHIREVVALLSGRYRLSRREVPNPH
jgi:hypothetical protein